MNPLIPLGVIVPALAARTACAATTLEGVFRRLSAVRFNLSTEKLTQADIAATLVEAYGEELVSREHRLGAGDIPDFLIEGRWVVEAKGPRHRAGPTLRQLERYAAYPQVEGLILATSRAMQMPSTAGGKPLLTLNLGRAWL